MSVLLASRIRHGERVFFTPPKEHTIEGYDRASQDQQSLLIDTVILDAQNVMDYIDSFGTHEFDLSTSDGMIPPWPRTWIEFAPRRRDGGILRCGIMVEAHSVEVGDVKQWVITLKSFQDDPEFSVMHGPLQEISLRLDGRGCIVGGFDENETDLGKYMVESGQGEKYSHGFNLTWLVALLAFQFANCKNVDCVEVLPTRQQRRLAERKGEPFNTHRVLTIDPNTTRKVYQGDEGPMPINKRMHICRGHFATYTEAAPLFGKLTGRFWVPAHVRGKNDHGVASKDYRILAG